MLHPCYIAISPQTTQHTPAALLLQSSSKARDARTSVHRCLVFLGDLSRYASQAALKATPLPTAAAAANGSAPTPAAASAGGGGSGDGAATSKSLVSRAEWNRAVAYYRLAAHVLPRSGHPYNQLGVMAFWSGDELRAVYQYARSLCVGVPFLTARENLLQLFQRNRERCVCMWEGVLCLFGMLGGCVST